MVTLNDSRGLMTSFMLQEIHSQGMLAGRSARMTVTMTWPMCPVHDCTREPGGIQTVMIPT